MILRRPSGFIVPAVEGGPATVRRCGGSARRNGARPAHGHQMHELGSIDVMRLDRTLGPVASRCLRIKLYFDENFP
jgi:hypothetical protein